MSQTQFVVIAGPETGKTFIVREGAGHQAGRHENTAYTLAKDPRVSRFHCEFVCENGEITVFDRGGSGGVMVNGLKIVESQTLKHGDVVQIGDSQLRLQVATSGEHETIRKGGPAETDPAAVEQLAEMKGRTLAHFEIKEIMGKGPTSMVFKAKDNRDGKTVALKIMEPSFSQDEEEMQRFVRAMKTTMPLSHPNLIQLHGAGKSGPYCWVSMEFVEGEALSDMIKRIGVAGMLDWKNAFRVAVHIARALEYAQSQNIIHRNISPPNIIVEANTKTAKLGDLMLAKALEGSMAKQVTRPGEIVGDVNYMSPERTKGGTEEVDGRSDIFSLGCTVYALLTGKPPFQGAGMVDTIKRIRESEPAKPSTFQIGIPSNFEAVVMKMLAKIPAQRYQTAAEVVQELERIGKFSGMQV